MFEAISVPARTNKTWTVAISVAGQSTAIALAILAPLAATQGLPKVRMLAGLLAEPPASAPHRAPRAATEPARATALRPTPVFQAPPRIPGKVTMIQDPPTVLLTAAGATGVPGGVEGGTGSGNTLIDGMRGSGSGAPPLPKPDAERPAANQPSRVVAVSRLQEAKLIYRPSPIYPQLARAARIQGSVRLQAVIARDGTILDLHVLSGHPLLISAAMSAVQQWRYQPTYLGGQPVEVVTEILVNFTLQQ